MSASGAAAAAATTGKLERDARYDDEHCRSPAMESTIARAQAEANGDSQQWQTQGVK